MVGRGTRELGKQGSWRNLMVGRELGYWRDVTVLGELLETHVIGGTERCDEGVLEECN